MVDDILTGIEAHPRRGADGARVDSREAGRLGSKSVKSRGLEVFPAVASERFISEIVSDDEENVGATVGKGFDGYRCAERSNEKQQYSVHRV